MNRNRKFFDASAMEPAALRAAFAVFDTDGSGSLSRAELLDIFGFCRKGPHAFKLDEAENAVHKIIADCDVNGDGDLQFEEFVVWWTKPIRARTQGSHRVLQLAWSALRTTCHTCNFHRRRVTLKSAIIKPAFPTRMSYWVDCSAVFFAMPPPSSAHQSPPKVGCARRTRCIRSTAVRCVALRAELSLADVLGDRQYSPRWICKE